MLIKILFEFTCLFKLHNILKNLNSLQYKLEKGVGEGGRFKGFIIGWNKRSNADFTVGIYIYIITGVFHTAKSRIVLNNYGAVLTKLFYSILFHIGFYTELFRRPTKR